MKTTKTKKFSNKAVSKFRDFSDSFIEDLSKNKADRIAYLTVALEDYEKERNLPALLLALRTLSISYSNGIQSLAQETSLSRQTIYKALSPKGNPSFALIDKIINGLGMKITVQSR